MITLKVRAKGTGRVVNWMEFKQGELVDQSRISLTPTTVLPDVITDVLDKCISFDPSYSIETLFPNGPTTAQFDIVVKGNGFQVICNRRLARGLFPLNPIAAEFGANYDVLLTITSNNPNVEQELASTIENKYIYKEILKSEQSTSQDENAQVN